jgi:tRNA pseudouridine55 synthase
MAEKRDIHGWIALDKPVDMTSTKAVSVVKRALRAKKAGHAGTLDPLASGCLPIALGEATKTVPYVMDGIKIYDFTVTWGIETDSCDLEGEVIRRSEHRPDEAAIHEVVKQFQGKIIQKPPAFSAVKIQGQRAYDLAREGKAPDMPSRTVQIDYFNLMSHQGNKSCFQVQCGKGTYVRSLARDMGQMLGCYGTVSSLRRLTNGPFQPQHLITLDDLVQKAEKGSMNRLLPLHSVLGGWPQVILSEPELAMVQKGHAIANASMQGLSDNTPDLALALYEGQPVALGRCKAGYFDPFKVFQIALQTPF